MLIDVAMTRTDVYVYHAVETRATIITVLVNELLFLRYVVRGQTNCAPSIEISSLPKHTFRRRVRTRPRNNDNGNAAIC